MAFFRRRFGKYNAKKTEIDGIKFDSMREGARYRILKERQDAGQIEGLTCHPRYILQEGFKGRDGKKIREIAYEADFRYWDRTLNLFVIEDVKGMVLPEYRLKKKLFLKQMKDDEMFVEVK